MSGILKIIATPIGNINDISKRALQELSQAQFILAEDTRHTKNLLIALGIDTKNKKLISCHSHNEKDRESLVLEKLQNNEDVAYVSDAGCPGISDPGSLLVKGAIKNGFNIEVIPGPSALTTSLMASGLNTARFIFLGFLPKTLGARKKLLKQAQKTGFALVIFESPLRVINLLKELHEIMGPCPTVVARELTKKFETFHRGALGQNLIPPFLEKGECVVIVEGSSQKSLNHIDDEQIIHFIKEKHEEGLSNKDIVQCLVKEFFLRKNQAYEWVTKIIS